MITFLSAETYIGSSWNKIMKIFALFLFLNLSMVNTLRNEDNLKLKLIQNIPDLTQETFNVK